MASAALLQEEAAATLLAEVAGTLGVRQTDYYGVYLPSMMRTCLGIGELDLAERLADDFEPRHAYAQHALIVDHASLNETRGDLQIAADAYADAADRWERFGVVPEHAFALLGQGRCLLGLARATEPVRVLQRAREIFDRLQAAPALAETDALLEQATVLSS